MSATAQALSPPSKTLMFLEGRAFSELGAFLGALPLLSLAPKGDGHPVLVLPGLAWFLIKSLSLVFVMIWLRWTLPRLRIDQLMYVCWKVLLPISFVNFLAVGVWYVYGR